MTSASGAALHRCLVAELELLCSAPRIPGSPGEVLAEARMKLAERGGAKR